MFFPNRSSIFDDLANEHIACLLLRHERGEISWASFLKLAGEYSDAIGVDGWECERFYGMLNELEDREYAPAVSTQQRALVEDAFSSSLLKVRDEYHQLRERRRRPTIRSSGRHRDSG